MYDSKTNAWSMIQPFPIGLQGAVSFVINGQAYVGTGSRLDTVGGQNNNFAIQNFYKLDTTQTPFGWVPVTAYPGPQVFNAFSFVLNGLAYVGGGSYGTGTNASSRSSNQLYSFNPNNPQQPWSLKSYLDSNITSLPRASAVAFVINGFAYLGTGGAGAGGSSSDFYQYTVNQDTWTQVNNYEDGTRSGAVGASFPLGKNGSTSYLGYCGISNGNIDWFAFNPFSPQILNN